MVDVEYWGNTSNWHKPIYLIEGSFWCLFTLRTLLFLFLSFYNEQCLHLLFTSEHTSLPMCDTLFKTRISTVLDYFVMLHIFTIL